MKRILLLFTVIHISLAGTIEGISSSTRRSGKLGQTAFFSGATSSTYTATHVDNSAGTAGADAGATSSSTGVTGTEQQFQPAFYQGEENEAIGLVAPPSLASAYNVGPSELNAVMRPGEYVPNCGCVARGACQAEIAHYTRLVGAYSDVVCGRAFERCCFDGPCPGVLDEFVRAAPCVPQEQCLRPYGVLPTDVRDFGIIAPCPGQGAVRCITVDDTQLLQFQAAVAAIEASREKYTAALEAVADAEENLVVPPSPQQVVVPIVPARTPVPAPVVVPAPLAPAPTPVVVPVAPAPSPVVAPVAPASAPVFVPETPAIQPQPEAVVVPAPVTGQTTTVTTGTPDEGLISNIAALLAENGIGPAVQTVSKGETGIPAQPIRRPIPPPKVTTTYTTSGSKVPASAEISNDYDCRSSGCYTPSIYRSGCRSYGCYGYGYPSYGYGLGKGVGFHKSFHFSKGFGVFG